MTDPRLDEWLLRWEEGDLSPKEVEELSALLRRDPEARQALRLHSMMTQGIHESLAPALQSSPAAAPPWRRIALAGAAAALLLGLLLAVFLTRKAEPAPVAMPPTTPSPEPPVRKAPPPTPPAPETPNPVEVPVPPRPIAPPTPPAPTPEPPKPPPAPEIKPEPPAPPAEPDKKPAPAPTVTAVAKLERVSGQVTLQKNPAKSAQEILAGQSLETGPGAEAVVVYRDLVRLTIAPGASVSEFSERRVTIFSGIVAVEFTGPFALRTPQAEITGASPTFCILASDAESTRVDVGAGKVRLARLNDGRALDVSAGQTANALDLAVRPLLRQDKKKKAKKDLEFDFKVDSAIRSGVNFLREEAEKANLSPLPDGGFPVELALWALQHGGLPETDPVFQKLFQHMIGGEPARTYRVSLQAMILEELDRVKYQARIAQCAQFLVDNQAKNGQWAYGEPVPLSEPVPTSGKAKKDVATPAKVDAKDKQTKPKVVQKVAVTKRRDGPAGGDNSNSQYAALGLRACHDAGVVVPVEVLKRAQAWWRGSQESTKKLEAAGWTYGEAATPGGRSSYGSMTAGAAGSLVLYHYMLGEPWPKDEAVLKGMEWMSGHFTVTENPGHGDPAKREEYSWHYYYLYALERFGILYGTDVIGAHDWYLEGATYLLKEQKADGSWSPKPGDGFTVHDTAFAILFLRRATRPLNEVASVDRYHK